MKKVFCLILLLAISAPSLSWADPFSQFIRKRLQAISDHLSSSRRGWNNMDRYEYGPDRDSVYFERAIRLRPSPKLGENPEALCIFLNIPEGDPSHVIGKGFAWRLSILPRPDFRAAAQDTLKGRMDITRAIIERALKNSNIEHTPFQTSARYPATPFGRQDANIYFGLADEFKAFLDEVDRLVTQVETEGPEVLNR